MKSETILEVVNTLIGSTEPYGSTHIDINRYGNQENLIDLATWCIENLIRNSNFKDRVEYSIKEIGDRAYESLRELYELIEKSIE